ncbi:unnamed protein product, partial [marine sediment metagenome]
MHIIGENGGGAYTIYRALIASFKRSDLSIVAQKRYAGAAADTDDWFIGIATDGTNLFAVGLTSSEGEGGLDALVVKFDSNLNILARKTYGGSEDDAFYA